ncbi:hypothetical protein AWZ03_000959 [Drosophila navojoa]|uniref:MADF domain-containing protein n=1 Tax=Drosophila navojoa TaxID=7232 RepID=A0A484BV74_DRONA|nr:transcription factor Adf-1 [Drosophila navojoa]TDG52726.1 hypothetical protein AWZ03_000959 [Drosophila navojoa]
MSTCSQFDNRLIELVRSNPSLYEREVRKSPYDSSKKKKTELWCSIATSLKTDVNTCITRWNFIREKFRKELLKDHSDWDFLPKLQFIAQPKHHSNNGHHIGERQVVNRTAPLTANWNSQGTEELIENDEEDALQEAMDEQHASTVNVQPPLATAAPPPSDTSFSDGAMKRIEALLQGLGANRSKAEKKIVAYLCKCNLRALNDEQIDDIFI